MPYTYTCGRHNNNNTIHMCAVVVVCRQTASQPASTKNVHENKPISATAFSTQTHLERRNKKILIFFCVSTKQNPVDWNAMYWYCSTNKYEKQQWCILILFLFQCKLQSRNGKCKICIDRSRLGKKTLNRMIAFYKIYLWTKHNIGQCSSAIVKVDIQLIQIDFLIDEWAQVAMQQISAHLLFD